MTDTVRPTTPQSLDAGTTYRVFRLSTAEENPSPEVWEPVNTATARTAELAIKAVVAKLAEKDQQGTFAATPARSWTAVTVRTKTTTTLHLEEAKS